MHTSSLSIVLRYQPPRPAPSPPPIGSPLRPAPPIDQPSNFPVQILLMIGLGIALVFVAVVFVRFTSRRKKPAHLQQTATTGASGLVFAGKLDLYIVEGTIDDHTDTSQPQTFTFTHSRRVSVQTILKKCQLPNTFPGADQIYFNASAHGSLQIRNHSDCAIFVGSDVLVKNKPYMLRHKGNVRIRDISALRELIISPRFLYRA